MSDYISLEELKKLDNRGLHERWGNRLFPFDMAGCGNCITLHTLNFCEVVEHEAVTLVMKQAIGERRGATELYPHLEAIYSLRLFYKDLYASNPPEIETLEVAPVEDHVKVG